MVTWDADEYSDTSSICTVICSVEESDSAGYKIRKVKFYKESVQAGNIIAEDEEIGSIIAAFPLRDVSQNLMTVWENGSAYEVIIFSYIDGKIQKTLDVGTRSYPELVFENGHSKNPSIVITDLDWVRNKKSGDLEQVPTFATIYRWTGSEFQQSSKIPWAKRFTSKQNYPQ